MFVFVQHKMSCSAARTTIASDLALPPRPANVHLRSAQFFAACTAVARLPRAGEQHKPNANAGFQSLDIFYKFLIGGKTSLGSRTLLSVDTVTVEFEETLLRRFAVTQPDMTD
jgi:hypothetical protein